MKRLLVTLIVICAVQSVSAQQTKTKFNPALSRDQIGLSVGFYQSTNSGELDEGINYGVDWYHYFNNIVGVRGGVSYVDNMADGIHLARLPLGVTLRISHYGSAAERLAYSAANYIVSHDHSIGSAIMSFIPFDVEFSAGITPGVLLGSKESKSLAITGGESYEHGVRVRHRFSATADVGGSLSVRISRVMLRVTPMYHYSLTDNFDIFTSKSSDTKMARSFFSLGGSLSWMF